MKIYKINFKHEEAGKRSVYIAMESLDLLHYLVEKLRGDGEKFVDLRVVDKILLDPIMRINENIQYRLVDLSVLDKLRVDDINGKRVFTRRIANKYLTLTHSEETFLNDMENLQMYMEGGIEEARLTNDILYTFSNIEYETNHSLSFKKGDKAQ